MIPNVGKSSIHGASGLVFVVAGVSAALHTRTPFRPVVEISASPPNPGRCLPTPLSVGQLVDQQLTKASYLSVST